MPWIGASPLAVCHAAVRAAVAVARDISAALRRAHALAGAPARAPLRAATERRRRAPSPDAPAATMRSFIGAVVLAAAVVAVALAVVAAALPLHHLRAHELTEPVVLSNGYRRTRSYQGEQLLEWFVSWPARCRATVFVRMA